MNLSIFSLPNLSDTELAYLYTICGEELARRNEERKRLREKWIDDSFFYYLSHPNATAMRVGDTTVVAIYSRYNDLRMGRATPIKGDAFDERVGIAVAYAKACGESIPDYI